MWVSIHTCKIMKTERGSSVGRDHREVGKWEGKMYVTWKQKEDYLVGERCQQEWDRGVREGYREGDETKQNKKPLKYNSILWKCHNKTCDFVCWLKIKNKYYCYHSHQNNYNHLHAELSEGQAGFELSVLLSQSPGCWDSRHVPSHIHIYWLRFWRWKN